MYIQEESQRSMVVNWFLYEKRKTYSSGHKIYCGRSSWITPKFCCMHGMLSKYQADIKDIYILNSSVWLIYQQLENTLNLQSCQIVYLFEI